MKKFVHSTHTAWEIRQWKKRKNGIVLIKLTGDRMNLRTLLQNICFRIHRTGQKKWFVTIRLPFFYLMKDNCNIHIGFPNIYIWVVK